MPQSVERMLRCDRMVYQEHDWSFYWRHGNFYCSMWIINYSYHHHNRTECHWMRILLPWPWWSLHRGRVSRLIDESWYLVTDRWGRIKSSIRDSGWHFCGWGRRGFWLSLVICGWFRWDRICIRRVWVRWFWVRIDFDRVWIGLCGLWRNLQSRYDQDRWNLLNSAILLRLLTRYLRVWARSKPSIYNRGDDN